MIEHRVGVTGSHRIGIAKAHRPCGSGQVRSSRQDACRLRRCDDGAQQAHGKRRRAQGSCGPLRTKVTVSGEASGWHHVDSFWVSGAARSGSGR